MRLRAAIAVACLVGTGIAAYLTYVHYAHVAPICTSGGCEKVQTSRYAELAGVPVALLGLVAYVVLLGIAAYLTYVHYAHTTPVCTTGGCEKVQKSRYAELGGVPVALLGLVMYVVLLATTLVRGVTAAFAAVLVALGGLAFSGYLLWAQLGPIGAICQWCLGNDLTITVVAVLYVVRMLTESPKQKPA